MEKFLNSDSQMVLQEGKLFSARLANRNMLENLLTGILFMSPALIAINRLDDQEFLDVNHRFIRYTGYSREKIIGCRVNELNILDKKDQENICRVLRKKGAVYNEEIQYRTQSGDHRVGIYSAEVIPLKDMKIVISVHHDITERRLTQDALNKMELEKSQLSAELEDVKNALRVIFKSRREDQEYLEARLQRNINELIIPYITKLENCTLDEKCKNYLNILKLNFQDIVSPFLNNLYSSYKDLTPTEIAVVVMVKNGVKSKSIADLLGISVGTVDTHRNNIRKKLGLKRGKTNLRSYLLSLS